jgi:SAM-dependent methyltransferase
MRNWNPEEYKRLVERTKDPHLREIMRREKLHIKECVSGSKSRTAVDSGTGTGRLIPFLSKLFHDVIAVDINPKMVEEARKRARPYKNVNVVQGDVVELDKVLDGYGIETRMPIVISALNTLGTSEGDPYEMVSGMKKVAKKDGEMVITLFCKYSLKYWGIKMYEKLQSLVGKPDLSKCDFKKGMFKTEYGYSSKWWSLEEISNIFTRLEDLVSVEWVNPYFYIIHADYTGRGELMKIGYKGLK